MEDRDPSTLPEQSAAIARLIVGVMTQYTGRGPTKAHAMFTAEDIISVVLRDTLTKGERALVAHGEAGVVAELRHAFQRVMQTAIVAGVEQITGREVLSFLSDHRVSPDVTASTFVLKPVGQPAVSIA